MVHPFRFGLGTAGHTHEECVESVITALDIGYRHLDTAQLYGTELAVGEGLSKSDVPRSKVFVSTKVHPENMRYEDVLTSVHESRDRLGIECIDLLYVHWPLGEYDPPETLSAFAELQEEQVIRHVGVSNFTIEMLEEAHDVLKTPIYAHQIEMHPLLPQTELLEYAQRHGLWLVAYSPIARGGVFDISQIQTVAKKHDVTPAQVSLAWLLQKANVAVIPKATGRNHLEENFRAASIDLDREDVELIDSIEETKWVMNETDSTILSRYGAHPLQG